MTIRKVPGKREWRIYSLKTHMVNGKKKHKILGTFKTRKDAVKRLKQIEYFKRAKGW